MHLDLLECAELDGNISFFCLGKFGPKNQNCLSQRQFGGKTNSNVLDTLTMLIFLCFRPEKPYLGISKLPV